MLTTRNVKLDLAALGLLAVALFLTLSLFSFDPLDPPSSLAYPERTEIANTCGRLGAWSAHFLLESCGLAAYYLVLSLGVLDGALLTRRRISAPFVRLIGWLLSLSGIATISAMALGRLAPGPAIGAGGYLGAALRGYLESHFASAGAYLLLMCVTIGGLLLCTDYVLLHLAMFVFGKPTVSLSRGLTRLLQSRMQPVSADRAASRNLGPGNGRRVTTDLDRVHGTSADDSASGVSVRRGKAALEADGSGKTAEGATTATTPAKPDGKDGQSSAAAATTAAAGVDPPVRNRAKKTERQTVMEELEAASQGEEASDYELPPMDLLLPSEPFSFDEQEKEVRRKAKVLEQTFASFGFQVKVVEIETGPVIAQFEVELEAGLRLSKITGLADDLAIALRVPSVRIVAPIPGKNTVGIEVPNADRQLVRLREVMEEGQTKAQKMRIPIYLGSDVSGKPMVADLTSLPHLLIAGRTGTGKSVCLNTIIMSMLMTRRPDEVRMLFIDPKMVELSPYMKLPHLMHPVVTDMKKAEAILAWAVEKMEERYSLLARAGVRHISVYNQLGEEELMERLQPEDDAQREQIPRHLPYIVIVADEMADLMMTAAKEVEQHIIRLAQKSRAVGIHLVLATQKPSVDVITGLIKSNLPARISFQVASRVDSRVVLDEMGADKLLGNGDMLFLWPGTSTLLRGQGAFVSDDEITNVVNFVATTEPQYVAELVQLKSTSSDDAKSGEGKFSHRDELYEAAIDIVIREGRGSVSLLQRSLGIGYGRAARLIDYMAEDAIVGQYNGSQAREVLITAEQWAAMSGQEAASESPRRIHQTIRPHDDSGEDDAEESSPPIRRPKANKTASSAQRLLPAPEHLESEEEEVDELLDQDEFDSDAEDGADDDRAQYEADDDELPLANLDESSAADAEDESCEETDDPDDQQEPPFQPDAQLRAKPAPKTGIASRRYKAEPA